MHLSRRVWARRTRATVEELTHEFSSETVSEFDGAPYPKIVGNRTFFLLILNSRRVPRPWDFSSGLRRSFYFSPNQFLGEPPNPSLY